MKIKIKIWQRFALSPRPPSYWGLWAAPELLTSGL